MSLKPLIISAPWGNYLNWPGFTSTAGTFTSSPRGGLLYRLWRCALTLRYLRRQQGWINRLGLPNPGIDSFTDCAWPCDKVVSVHGFNPDDWLCLRARIRDWKYRPLAVELNLSCPNVGDIKPPAGCLGATHALLADGHTVVAKLPPFRWMAFATQLYDEGVRHFHCCNTIPTPGGGLSGKPLRQFSLWAVSEIKQRWGGAVKVVGGGGVSHQQDVDDYRRAGADHVAVGSVLLNPLNWRRVRNFR